MKESISATAFGSAAPARQAPCNPIKRSRQLLSFPALVCQGAILLGGLAGFATALAPDAAVAATRLPRAVNFGEELAVASARSTASTVRSTYYVDQFKADVAQMRHLQSRVGDRFDGIGPATAAVDAGVRVPKPAAPFGATADLFDLFFFPGLRHPEIAQLASASTGNSGLDLLQVPVGRVVIPQIPPLGTPDDYLPESPDLFNGYVWPTRGTVTSGYGMRWGRLHQGIDIAAPVGTPIVAASSGEVIKSGWGGGYGKLVKLKHHDGSVTLYAHNSRLLVRSGQQVRQGQQIAALGNTGRSTGPHLHFEVHPKGRGAANPIAYLPKTR